MRKMVMRVTIFSWVRPVSGLVDVMSGSALSGITPLILAFQTLLFSFTATEVVLE